MPRGRKKYVGYQEFANRVSGIIGKVCPKTDKTAFSVRRRFYYELLRTRMVMERHLQDRHYIWGIDPSYAGTGFAVLDLRDGSIILQKFVTNSSVPVVMRTKQIVHWLSRRYMLYKPLLVIMESAFFDSKTAMSFILSKLNHVLEYELLNMGGCLYKGLSPTTIKKYIAGKGFANKEEVQKAVLVGYGHKIDDNDMNDAYAMAVIGVMIITILREFDATGYDVNEPASMLKFAKAMAQFISPDKFTSQRFEAIQAVFTGVSYGMNSLINIVPEIKVRKVVRKPPKFLQYSDYAKVSATQLLDLKLDPGKYPGEQNDVVTISAPDAMIFDEVIYKSRQ